MSLKPYEEVMHMVEVSIFALLLVVLLAVLAALIEQIRR
jgi:hypothetical protein